jgi:micrococcal nuclease
VNTSSELIEKAVAEAKSGNKAGAKKILVHVVRQEPGNAQAWYVLSRVVEEKEQIIYCLNQVLRIIPDSPQARARLKKLQSTAKSSIQTQIRRTNRLGLIILIGSAGAIEFFLILIALYLGVNTLGLFSMPTPTTIFLQPNHREASGVNPVLAFTETPESKPIDPVLAFPTNTETFAEPSTPSLNPTITTIPVFTGAPACIPTNAQTDVGNVVRVIDGDTIEVLINGLAYRVRYIGIDTPETNDPEMGIEPFGPEAAAKNKELVEGKEIVLVKDVSETDQYGRLLRYVFVGDLSGIFVNDELVASGYASTSTYPPDVACAETFSSAERNARSNEYGLWAPIPILLPTESRIVEDGENCDPSYPDVCIPPYPPDLDCGEIQFKRFRVLPPDPHGFDGDYDGIGCER